MPFLTPNQQCQSIKGKWTTRTVSKYVKHTHNFCLTDLLRLSYFIMQWVQQKITFGLSTAGFLLSKSFWLTKQCQSTRGKLQVANINRFKMVKTADWKYLFKKTRNTVFASSHTNLTWYHVHCSCCCSFGQGSSLLWTHMLRPFYDRPLTQEGRSLVDDACEYKCDWRVR